MKLEIDLVSMLLVNADGRTTILVIKKRRARKLHWCGASGEHSDA